MIVNNTPPILIGPMGGGSSENSSVSGEVAGLGFTKILAGQLSVEPKIDLETLGSLSQKPVEESRPKEDADSKDAAVSDQSVEMVMAFVMPSQPMEAKPVVASEASPESSTSSIDTIETGGSGQELFTHTDSAAPTAASSASVGSQANVSSDSGLALTGAGWVLEQQTTTVDPNIVSSEQAVSAASTPEPASASQTSTTAAAFENAAGNSVPSTANTRSSSEKPSPSTDGMRTSSFGSANSSEVGYKAQVIRDALSRVIQRLMERTDAHWTPRFRPSYQGTPVSTPIDSSLLQQAQKAADSTQATEANINEPGSMTVETAVSSQLNEQTQSQQVVESASVDSAMVETITNSETAQPAVIFADVTVSVPESGSTIQSNQPEVNTSVQANQADVEPQTTGVEPRMAASENLVQTTANPFTALNEDARSFVDTQDRPSQAVLAESSSVEPRTSGESENTSHLFTQSNNTELVSSKEPQEAPVNIEIEASISSPAEPIINTSELSIPEIGSQQVDPEQNPVVDDSASNQESVQTSSASQQTPVQANFESPIASAQSGVISQEPQLDPLAENENNAESTVFTDGRNFFDESNPSVPLKKVSDLENQVLGQKPADREEAPVAGDTSPAPGELTSPAPGEILTTEPLPAETGIRSHEKTIVANQNTVTAAVEASDEGNLEKTDALNQTPVFNPKAVQEESPENQANPVRLNSETKMAFSGFETEMVSVSPQNPSAQENIGSIISPDMASTDEPGMPIAVNTAGETLSVDSAEQQAAPVQEETLPQMQMNSSAQGDTTPVSTETVRVDQKIMADYKAVGGDLSKLHLVASSNQKAVEDNVVDLKSEAEPASNTTDDTKSEIHPVVSSGQQVVEKAAADSETEITLASNSTEPQDTLAATAEESLPEIHPELIDTSIPAEFTGEADSEISLESFSDAAVAVEPKPNVVSENEIPETIAAPILAKEQEAAQQNQAAETDPNSGTEPTLLAAVSEQVAEVNSTAQAEPVRKTESSESTNEADDSDSETAEIVSKAESSSILKEAALDASLTGDDPDPVSKKAKAKEGPEALSNPMVSTLSSTSTTPVEPKSSKSDGSDDAQVIRSVNAPQTAPASQTTKSSAASIASERKMPEIPAEKFVDQVVKSVRLEVGDGRSEMNIRLDPPELGRLHVKLITEAGHVTAGFHAESEGARSLLEASLPALRTALTDSGIQVNHVAVLSGSDFGQLHQQSSEQQSAPKHRGHSSDSNSTTGVEGIQSIDSVTDPNAAVDYFA